MKITATNSTLLKMVLDEEYVNFEIEKDKVVFELRDDRDIPRAINNALQMTRYEIKE
jgi:hypothetical protein